MRIPDEIRKQVLEEERRRLMELAWDRKGAISVTGQHVQVYKRFLEKTMGYGLAVLEYRTRPYPYAYIHVPSLWTSMFLPHAVEATLLQGGHFMNAVHLGAIEPLHGRRDRKSSNGYYRLTESGRSFALGDNSLPAWINVFHGQCLEVARERIFLEQALRRKKDHDWAGGATREEEEPLVRLPKGLLEGEEPRLLPRSMVYLPDASDIMMRKFLTHGAGL